MKMTLSLKDKTTGKTLFNYNPNEKLWWITGFDPSNQNAQANNLIATVTIDFSGKTDLWDSFKKSWGKVWDINNESKIATLIW